MPKFLHDFIVLESGVSSAVGLKLASEQHLHGGIFDLRPVAEPELTRESAALE
jgi:hypothetical protein